MINLDSYKLFVKKFGILGITNFLVALNTIILIPILTKTLTTTDYGIYVQINITFFLITSIANLGLPYTLVRYLSAEKDKAKIQEGFYSMAALVLFSGTLVSLIVFVFSSGIAGILFGGNTSVVTVLSPIVFFGTLNALLIDFFITFGYMKRYSVLLLLQTYLTLILVSYFAVSGQGILMVVIGFLISQIILFIIMVAVIVREIGFKIPKFSYIREYLNFALPIIPNNLSTWLVESSDRYVIAFILGTTYVAYYSPGYTIGMAILLFFTPLSILLSSILPRYYESGDLTQVILYIKYSLKYFILIAIPLVFLLSLLSKPIMMVITTPEIASNGYLVTPFVAVSALLFGAYGIMMNFIILEKKTKIIGMIWTIAALISLLNIVFVPIFGILAAAAITLLSYATAFLISLIYSRKQFEFKLDYFFLLKCIFASILISIIIVIAKPVGMLSLVVVMVASMIIYIILIYIMRGINKKEIDFFKDMLKNN